MESSSTTVNIQSPVGVVVESAAPATFTPPEVKLKHNHLNNGRYKKGCPLCAEKWPDGPPKKAKPAKDDEVARLKAELARSYTQQVEKPKQSSDDATRELAQIMLRREAKQLLKDEAQEQRRDEARADFLRVAKEQEEAKVARETNCSHTKDNGRSAIAQSQIHNDGFLHPFCQRCFKTFPKRRPHQEQMATSIDG